MRVWYVFAAAVFTFYGRIAAQCPVGKYGAECDMTCGHCRDERECASASGECQYSGCDPAYTGKTCHTLADQATTLRLKCLVTLKGEFIYQYNDWASSEARQLMQKYSQWVQTSGCNTVNLTCVISIRSLTSGSVVVESSLDFDREDVGDNEAELMGNLGQALQDGASQFLTHGLEVDVNSISFQITNITQENTADSSADDEFEPGLIVAPLILGGIPAILLVYVLLLTCCYRTEKKKKARRLNEKKLTKLDHPHNHKKPNTTARNPTQPQKTQPNHKKPNTTKV